MSTRLTSENHVRQRMFGVHRCNTTWSTICTHAAERHASSVKCASLIRNVYKNVPTPTHSPRALSLAHALVRCCPILRISQFVSQLGCAMACNLFFFCGGAHCAKHHWHTLFGVVCPRQSRTHAVQREWFCYSSARRFYKTTPGRDRQTATLNTQDACVSTLDTSIKKIGARLATHI